jgi:hypothetical protein
MSEEVHPHSGLGYRYVPDAWRAFSVPSGRLLHCLLAPL